MVKYFRQHGATWELSEDVRRMVEFRELNLVRPWPALPRMDLVFLRNVMIYFDVETKKSILGRVARLLRPDGYLLLGGAETTFNLDDSFRRVEDLKGGFYQLVGLRSRPWTAPDELVEAFADGRAVRRCGRWPASRRSSAIARAGDRGRRARRRVGRRPADRRPAATARLILSLPERTAAALARRVLAGTVDEP